jgi:hypothetical protein
LGEKAIEEVAVSYELRASPDVPIRAGSGELDSNFLLQSSFDLAVLCIFVLKKASSVRV